MKKINRFTPSDSMASLVMNHYDLLQVMSRFGIKVGFGDKSVQEVCDEFKVDCDTFLAVSEFVLDGYTTRHDSYSLSLEALLRFLRQSHVYFLEFYLPMIRRKLLDCMELRTDDVSFLILKFFDEYRHEVKVHMEYEESKVFAYIEQLLRGRLASDYSISTYSDHHEEVASKMRELKNLILRYCPEGSDVNLMNDVLFDMYRCEDELESHCMIEDELLVPSIERLEQKIKEKHEI